MKLRCNVLSSVFFFPFFMENQFKKNPFEKKLCLSQKSYPGRQIGFILGSDSK